MFLHSRRKIINVNSQNPLLRHIITIYIRVSFIKYVIIIKRTARNLEVLNIIPENVVCFKRGWEATDTLKWMSWAGSISERVYMDVLMVLNGQIFTGRTKRRHKSTTSLVLDMEEKHDQKLGCNSYFNTGN